MNDIHRPFWPLKKPSSHRIFAATRFCFAVMLAPSALAQGPALTEQESLRLGLARPDIISAIEATQAAARSETDAAGRWPNPTLEMQRESTPSETGRSTERSVVLSQQFDLAGKRGLRKAAANERALAATFDGDQRRLEAQAEIRRRFFEALYRKEVVAASSAWDARMAAIGATVQKLHQGGEVAGYDKRRIALERATVQAQLRSERAAYDKAMQILLTLAAGAPTEGEPTGELLPPDAMPLETLLARLDQHPELRAAERRAGAFGLERQAAQRGWVPDVTLGVGSKSVENGAYRERGTVISVAIPIPLFERDQSGAAKASAQAEGARAEARLQRARLEGELRGLWQQVRQLNAAAREYGEQANGAFDDLARVAEASYKGGETGILELLDAYRALHEARLRALELSWSARQGAIDLDTIAGSVKP
jgi:outer membrane protein, heavy metal efflux system